MFIIICVYNYLSVVVLLFLKINSIQFNSIQLMALCEKKCCLTNVLQRDLVNLFSWPPVRDVCNLKKSSVFKLSCELNIL